MPELPEVQTTVNGLNATVRGRRITDVWTDYKSAHKMHKDSIKDAKFYKEFCRKVCGHKILKAERRAKNILIHLSGGHTILVHMKMTGHLLYGDYERKNNKWHAVRDKALQDPFNQFIRFALTLDNGKHLVLSDMRRFAKVTIMDTDKLEESSHLRDIGPEPLETSFTYPKFKERLMKRPNGKVKQVLMDPGIIAGIGNIYSDEILWRAGVHPVSSVIKIPEKNSKEMFRSMKAVLNKGIDFGGDSMSDYRNVYGKAGKFQEHHNAYRRTGKKCTKKGCDGTIRRQVVGGRSAHYCDKHQKLFK
ncbi:bifunctional DNA-formamidopyrimidine glycosylase/DNA-(apurinic or apyrimidinic site) lyase [Candidatus Parcubacteria bacterium]|nr:bifunctional DNA-formamidopyrimidine glycosylase/DNA-(apurinic or apyrimidinic site) lyase [Candidatus Parcubacteria bacterium]